MLDILHEIIEAEQKAAEIVKNARETAAAKKSGFESEANERLFKAREDAKSYTREKVEDAQKSAVKRLNDSLANESDINARFREAHGKEIDNLEKDIIDFIITPEFQKA
jgi:vacuolar-type H+-ATPase subunit H